MTPDQFIRKWRAAELKESSAAQEHFIDLCRLLDEPTPADVDPTGDWYCFERGATKTTGGDGWADVWKRGHFAWEYKGKRKDLNAAFVQLQQYAPALENPPLLIVSDIETVVIHTNWTNSVSTVETLSLDDLRDARARQKLKAVLSDPAQLRPGLTRQTLTERVAAEFAELARALRERGHGAEAVAHFVNRLVFCMFAEDVGLLPNRMFSRMLEAALPEPDRFEHLASQLFGAMEGGGAVGFEQVDWFNGGLFDNDQALPLSKDEIALTLSAARRDWSDIDPSILGTLFERGLDPDKRSQLGAHYTDREKIMLLVEPVVVRPWLEEWEATKVEVGALLDKAHGTRVRGTRTRLTNQATKLYREFLNRLRSFRVLDPACGSGNFLYLALQALKDLEHRVGLDAEALGLQREFPEIGPSSVRGVEINLYAAELARVTVWIGEIQWMRRNGFDVAKDPILKPLNNVVCQDAVLTEDGREPDWPVADAIIGNPPFLGGKLLRDGLGDRYVDQLFNAYRGKVPAEADFVCYWFDKAWRLIASGRVQRAGLVATNSIRGGANRAVLDRIAENGVIFDAWDDEPWVVDGAAVRVSLVCFGREPENLRIALDGRQVGRIHPDLTAGAIDLTKARRLRENTGIAFMGDTKGGAFDIPGELAREWLRLPSNPNGRPNSDVLHPWINGMDVTRRASDKWIIDFGWQMTEADAALYEAPFQYAEQIVKPERIARQARGYAKEWWRHERPRPELRRALSSLRRYIVTPRVAKHRVFVWMNSIVVPDSATIAIASDDDVTFGILHSRFHEGWALRRGTFLGKGNDPRYTPTTTFETFPFPAGLDPTTAAASYADDPRAIAIADAARRLDEQRQVWLNPAEWVDWVDDVVNEYPKRPVAKGQDAARGLRSRTLTGLYNERPVWLENAHRALDEAVAAAYGWPADIPDDDALARLFALNQVRADA